MTPELNVSLRQLMTGASNMPNYSNPLAVQGPYQTFLQPTDEMAFRRWVQQSNVPVDPNDPKSDYDMRGFYKALMTGDPRAKQTFNPNDNRPHFPDTWKTPYHATFSKESLYAAQAAGNQWNPQDQLINPLGGVVFDERKQLAPKPFLGADAVVRRAK